MKAICGLRDIADLNALRITAHRRNIGRYRRLLHADLIMSDLERRFVRQRLAEEKASLMNLLGKPKGCSAERTYRTGAPVPA
jgi:hypothetical protein